MRKALKASIFSFNSLIIKLFPIVSNLETFCFSLGNNLFLKRKQIVSDVEHMLKQFLSPSLQTLKNDS